MALSINDALEIITQLDISTKYEIIPIEEASNRISAENISTQIPLPNFDNSSMDGYAFKYENINNPLNIIDTIFAGDNKNTILTNNTCVKIMTGAIIPKNATAVVPKEYCKTVNKNTILVEDKTLKKYSHIRFKGEDLKVNEKILKKGTEINFSHITLLSSQGISHIKVYKKPKVVVFSSGEELKLHYENIQSHQIYNSNTPTFLTRCKELNCDVTFIGQARDTMHSIEELISNSLDANLIISSGGVSVGDADFTKEAFLNMGFTEIFKKVNIKPGKQAIFGRIKDTYILNLPGNPLSGALFFEIIGKILIQKLLGSKAIYHGTILAKLANDLKNKEGSFTVIPGFYDGEYFYQEEKRFPGMVSSLSRSNSMIVLNDDISILKKNAQIKVLPINWNFFSENYKDFLTYK